MLDLQMNGTLDDLLEVAFGEFQHKVETVEVLWITGFNYIIDLDAVGMLKLSQ